VNSQSPIPRIGTVSRRTVLEALALGVAVVPQRGWTAQPTKIRAIAFDAFPIFDPRSVVAAARGFFPEQGDRLAAVWSQKLFDYTWIDTAAGRYEDFEALAAEALRFAAQSLHLDLPAPVHQALVAKYSTLDIWPDVVPVLTRLKDAGIRMAFLSNMTEAMLRSNTRWRSLRSACPKTRSGLPHSAAGMRSARAGLAIARHGSIALACRRSVRQRSRRSSVAGWRGCCNWREFRQFRPVGKLADDA